MEILNETLPRQGIEPDAFTYNTIIAGLARVVNDYEYSTYEQRLCRLLAAMNILFTHIIDLLLILTGNVHDRAIRTSPENC